MGRNNIRRHVQFAPAIKGFRPFGRFGGSRQNVFLTVDEFEVIRLLDYEHMNQEEAAVQMQISRPTLTRIYEKARIKFATALVEGSNLIIEGGDIELQQQLYFCNQCHQEIIVKEDKITNCPYCNSVDITLLDECYTKQCNQCRRCHRGGRHARI